MTTKLSEPTTLITVCDRCYRASCWQGEFYCDEARVAGTVQKHISELTAMALESPDYWRDRP